ncbi:hypothetical protein ASPACDRAFT_37831 [Aspergillus aculeatus ATCC 16872]|uniref:Uncharacterized protein n=1 Tax=Aspergillus aculeatus (strain ATCC 16872 / CBS 172.66 / WB 5094) TaxID=690307 RepID=A0A1L9X737_ASPA1|nr:uncharacterized protein ASPACDRAFT_37831 [Aspergillus aculeatus ATCC 16872]OJK04276.1 hypothetical protein ASPACDRAFT_37831 [Aspergillus aculeatus ATCC 16872]
MGSGEGLVPVKKLITACTIMRNDAYHGEDGPQNGHCHGHGLDHGPEPNLGPDLDDIQHHRHSLDDDVERIRPLPGSENEFQSLAMENNMVTIRPIPRNGTTAQQIPRPLEPLRRLFVAGGTSLAMASMSSFQASSLSLVVETPSDEVPSGIKTR